MNLTTVMIAAAVLVFLLMPFNAAAFSILFAGTIWLLREAHVRRMAGEDYAPAFRSLLWAAAVFSGLVGSAAGVLTALVFMDKQSGWGGILLFFTIPICLLGIASIFVFAGYARYRQPAPAIESATAREAA